MIEEKKLLMANGILSDDEIAYFMAKYRWGGDKRRRKGASMTRVGPKDMPFRDDVVCPA